jgi:hypothetical protein
MNEVRTFWDSNTTPTSLILLTSPVQAPQCTIFPPLFNLSISLILRCGIPIVPAEYIILAELHIRPPPNCLSVYVSHNKILINSFYVIIT